MSEHTVWRSDKATPERYGSSIGGDHQITDVWFVRLVNRENNSTVDINVYVAGFPEFAEDGKYEETGIEVALEWQEWEDADRTIEGFADVTYESGSDLAYPADDESVHDLFEHSCKRIALDYIRNAERDIWWDGHSSISH